MYFIAIAVTISGSLFSVMKRVRGNEDMPIAALQHLSAAVICTLSVAFRHS